MAKDASGRVTIREAPKGLAAEQAGLLAGDEILFIDGVAVADLTDAQLRQLLSGDAGDPVKLTVTRGPRVLRLTLHRTPAQRLRVAPPQPSTGSAAQAPENRREFGD